MIFFLLFLLFVMSYFIVQIVIDLKMLKWSNLNKRAQRALGRSPEEKVIVHSGAIFKRSLMLSTKYW